MIDGDRRVVQLDSFKCRMMHQSLCETCAWMRAVVTPKGSRFLLCQLSKSDPAYPKYPRQPVVRCSGYEEKKSANRPDQ